MFLSQFPVYKIDKNKNQFVFEDFGHWNQSMGLEDQRKSTILSRRRRNLRRHILKGVIVVTNNESMSLLHDMR